MSIAGDRPYVSRGGVKLAAAMDAFTLNVDGLVCADFGANVGGFTDCLLRRGAAKVYAIDTGYGTLAWTLRKDPRVVVMERTNAMHVELPETLDVVTIDAGWTKQRNILPNAVRVLKSTGRIVTLIKPHYEADKSDLDAGVLPANLVEPVMQSVCECFAGLGLRMENHIDSPILGQKGNREILALLVRVE